MKNIPAASSVPGRIPGRWTGLFLFPFFLLAGAPGRSQAPVDALHVPSRDYAAVAERELDAARESIDLYLYLFSVHPARPNAGPARLARALARAKKRGVRVRVVLDAGGKADPADDDRNTGAADFLRAAGVDVFFSTGPALHAKVLVTDGRTALVGSSNWSTAAFSLNGEANVLLRSTSAAKSLLEELDALPRSAPAAPPVDDEEVSLPARFVEDKNLLGRMVNRRDERAVDTALFLFSAAGNDKGFFAVDADALAHALALRGPTRVDDRRQVHKVLVRLRDRYGLIDLVQSFGRDPLVRLKSFPVEGPVRLPTAYASQGWGRRLSLSGKAFLLLSLYYSARSPLSPRWSVGQKALAARHGVSAAFLQQGVTELRRRNLMEVEYGDLTRDGGPRAVNTYTPNAFDDPSDLDTRFSALADRHGPEAFARARKHAVLVYEDDDLNLVAELIRLEGLHGPRLIDRAAAILGAKNPDNPKLSAGYLLGTIRSLARDPQKMP